MKNVTLRGLAMDILAQKHHIGQGAYKPIVILLNDREYERLDPDARNWLLRTRFSDTRGRVYVAIAPELYDRIDITARSRIRYYSFETPEEAIFFALKNVGLLASLLVW